MTNEDFKQLQIILDKLEEHYCPFLRFIDCMWLEENGEVRWNNDNNLNHLNEVIGETYSNELKGGSKVIGAYFICNSDNGCGDTETLIFDNRKRIHD